MRPKHKSKKIDALRIFSDRHFMRMEIETQLLLASRLHLIAEAATEPVLAQCDKVGRLLHGLLRTVDRQISLS